MDILVYDEVCIQKDITICRGLGGTMSNAEKDYASFVATSEKLRLWLTEPTRSCALVIKGAFKHNVSISPLSFLCAEISHLYGAIPNTIAIGHFCSLHVDSWQNPRANARGMMASLLGQLLSFREGFDLSFIDKQMIQDAKNDDIRVFCKIFRHLVAQMPKRSTLFCFVDTISIYETSQRLDETRIAFQTLANLLDPRGKSATFKLLVTSPGRSIPIEKYISDENIMVVPDFIDGDRHGVINLSYIQAEKM